MQPDDSDFSKSDLDDTDDEYCLDILESVSCEYKFLTETNSDLCKESSTNAC